MIDVVEELAKLLYKQNESFDDEGWENISSRAQDGWLLDAKEILTFLQPHITGREKVAWEGGRLRGMYEIINLQTNSPEVLAPDFDKWQAEQKGKV